nr:precorrin-6y C5,15-methyltransferase (decarboxylating) subunit CbiE [Corynebacterium lactis]
MSTPTGDASATASAQDSTPQLRVVGIGCDGAEGLSPRALAALRSARRIIGSPRQLALLDDGTFSALTPWPPKFWRNWAATLADIDPATDVVIGSGDPMFHGIGSSLVRELGRGAVEVIPAASSASLACAYLGWPLDSTPVVSLVTGAPGVEGAARVVPLADAGRRFLVLCRSADSVADVAEVLSDRPDTKLTALTNLGGRGQRARELGLTESVATGTVAAPPRPAGDLTVLAVEPSESERGWRGWLGDEDFITDGQLTKAPIRQMTVAALDPRPGALLWDVGGGTGSIGIEWARHGGVAEVFERSAERVGRIRENASALSGNVTVFHGDAPEVLGESKARPDAIFIGGGLTAPGMIDRCWEALAPGGRIVANTVTLESEALLWEARRRLGGSVTRLSVERAGAVGHFTAWRPALPVVQWVADKPRA